MRAIRQCPPATQFSDASSHGQPISASLGVAYRQAAGLATIVRVAACVSHRFGDLGRPEQAAEIVGETGSGAIDS